MRKTILLISLFISFTGIAQHWEQKDQYSEGLASVLYQGKWGFVDENDKLVIPYIYESANSFSEGLAGVKLNGKYGFINKQGKTVIDLKYEQVTSYCEGLAGVKFNGKWGFINKQGKLLIPFKYDAGIVQAPYFSDGLATVSLGEKCGYIDHAGNVVIPFNYEFCKACTEGLMSVSNEDWMAGYIDKSNRVVIPFLYQDAMPFREGFGGVKLKDKYGYINRRGQVLAKIMYDNVYDFSGGYSMVKLDGKYGYIDMYGKVVIPITYDIFDAERAFKAYLAASGEKNESKDARTEKMLQQFWQFKAYHNGDGKWTTELPEDYAHWHWHFRPGNIAVELSEGEAVEVEWRYDAATKQIKLASETNGKILTETYKVVSVTANILELQRKTEDGTTVGMRFNARSYPFFPMLPTSLTDLRYNTAVPFDELDSRFKENGLSVDDTRTIRGIQVKEYSNDAEETSVFLYSKGNDVVGYKAEMEPGACYKMLAEFKTMGVNGSYDDNRKKYIFRTNSEVIVISGLTDFNGELRAGANSIWVAIYDADVPGLLW
jgi:hypothetical protein